MASFNGPAATSLKSLQSGIKSMPSQHKSAFDDASKEALQKICDPGALHIWEANSDLDSLHHLTSVIAKLCNLGTRKDKTPSPEDGAMVIIAEDISGQDTFGRLRQLIAYLTTFNEKRHLEDTVAVYGSIIVVKGWSNARRSDTEPALKEAAKVIGRINTSIERAFSIGKLATCSEKKIVWHHGPAVHFLNHYISKAASHIRRALHAISITGAFDLTSSVKSSTEGRGNTLTDLQKLESFAKRLSVPVVLLDAPSQLITSRNLAHYTYYHAYYIHTLLPASVLRAHISKAQDELITYAFKLFGASKSKYGDKVTSTVKDQLSRGIAKSWAKKCIDSQTFTKDACRAAGNKSEIDNFVNLANTPLPRFRQPDSPLSAFARLAVGPSAPGNPEFHTCVPVDFSFAAQKVRISVPATFFILTPASKVSTEEKVRSLTQGTWMAVLERVRQEKGNPAFTHGDLKKEWKEVGKTCTWALDAAKGNMPKSVEEKVKVVKEKLQRGDWVFTLGLADAASAAAATGTASMPQTGGSNGISEVARANMSANQAYPAAQPMGGQMFPVQQGQMYAGQVQQGQQPVYMPNAAAGQHGGYAQMQSGYGQQMQPGGHGQQMQPGEYGQQMHPYPQAQQLAHGPTPPLPAQNAHAAAATSGTQYPQSPMRPWTR